LLFQSLPMDTLGKGPALSPSVASYAQIVGTTNSTSMSAAPKSSESFVNHDIPFVELGRLDSAPGENKEDFLLRVGQVLHAFTRETKHEACGALMQAESGAWRVRLTTNRAQLACVRMIPREVGYVFSGETIHSHPQPVKRERYLRVRANAVDSRLRGAFCGDHLDVDDYRFSDGDKENGTGYLVARGELFYLDALGQSHKIGDIDSSKPLPTMVIDGVWNIENQANAVLSSAVLSSVQTQQVWTRQDGEGIPRTTCPSLR